MSTESSQSSSSNPPLSDRQVERLSEIANNIETRLKRTVEDIYYIGIELMEAQQIVKRQFQSWVSQSLGMTPRSAYNFINVAKMLQGKCENFSHLLLPPSALYKLASPSTPEVVQTLVLELAASGNKITVKEVDRLIKQHVSSPPEVDAEVIELDGQVPSVGSISSGENIKQETGSDTGSQDGSLPIASMSGDRQLTEVDLIVRIEKLEKALMEAQAQIAWLQNENQQLRSQLRQKLQPSQVQFLNTTV